MEALDGNERQSGISPINDRHQVDRISTDRSYSTSNTMAATAVVSPTSSMYSNNPPPPYTTSWPTPHSTSGLISPPDSRRTSDNKTEAPQLPPGPPQHRQSLPSIHEALSTGPRPNAYPSPVTTSFPAQFSQGATAPRTFPPESSAYPSTSASHKPYSPPPPVHPQNNAFSRPEPGPFSEATRRSSMTVLASGPPNPYAGSRYPPETARFEPDVRLPERPQNGYTHQPPSQQPSFPYGAHQIPPTSHGGPTFTQPRYQSRDGPEMSAQWKSTEKLEPTFQQGLKRHLEGYEVENDLGKMLRPAREAHQWVERWHAIAQEDSSSQQPIFSRLPDSRSCADMIHNAATVLSALESLHEKLRAHEQSQLADQRLRDQSGRMSGYDDEMYGDDLKHQGYGENKKRRGRAAPPGRCHSCNRAETPEWRRGPDGARTLCNACGLHYAKLTRKNNANNKSIGGSSLNPKSMDGSDTRSLQ